MCVCVCVYYGSKIVTTQICFSKFIIKANFEIVCKDRRELHKNTPELFSTIFYLEIISTNILQLETRKDVKDLLCNNKCSRWILGRKSLPRSRENLKRTKRQPELHHHHVVQLSNISLTLSRHFSLSFIASGRSSGLHPVSSHSCWMYVRAGRPAFAQPYVGVHRSTSLMSSLLLLKQCPACMVRLTWIVFVMRGRWPYSWCLVVYIYIYIYTDKSYIFSCTI